METIPDSQTPKEALELLKKDVEADEKAIAGINADLTQNQFNALVSLRYNIGPIGKVIGLLEYLEGGPYQRMRLKDLINAYYYGIIASNPANEKYRKGWYSRTEKFLDIFFDGNYGDAPIDAVNGRVIIK